MQCMISILLGVLDRGHIPDRVRSAPDRSVESPVARLESPQHASQLVQIESSVFETIDPCIGLRRHGRLDNMHRTAARFLETDGMGTMFGDRQPVALDV